MDKIRALIDGAMGTPQYRVYQVREDSIDLDARTIEVAFSSEFEVDRGWCLEKLDHSPGAIRLGRLQDGAAFLVDHNTRDMVGVIEKVWIGDDLRGRALVRFGKSVRAEEIWNDIAIDKIRKNISVGYMVHEMKLERESDKGPDLYLVTDWEPFEISTVPIAADPTVGVDRGLLTEPKKEVRKMEPEVKTTPDVVIPVVDMKAERNAVRQAEKDRIREITFLGDKHGHRDLATEFANSDKSVDEFRAAVLEKMETRAPVKDSPDIGLTPKEAQQFSFLRSIDALINPGSVRKQEAAAFEMECSVAAAKKLGVTARGIMVPTDTLRRDMVAGTAASGGYLVGTDRPAGSFIDVLKNQTRLVEAGARLMPGLVGNVAISKKTAASTAYWVAENGAPTKSQPTLGQLPLSMKTIAAYTDISRSLIMQGTPEAEQIARDDIAGELGLGIDLAGLHGTGADNQPTGLAATSGIGSVAGGTNGLAATYANVVELETKVAVANGAVGNTGYMTNAKVRGLLKNVYRNTTGGDNPIWERGDGNGEGVLNGYKALVTNQVSSTLTKGDASAICSAIFFGNWADMIIAMWGGLDITIDPYSLSTTGAVRVVGFQSADIGIRNAGSFAAMLDCLT